MSEVFYKDEVLKVFPDARIWGVKPRGVPARTRGRWDWGYEHGS